MAVPGTPLILRLMTRSIAAAHQAGRLIRDILSSGNLQIETKGGDLNNLQTAADLAAQKCIVDALSEEFPDVKIIAEEDNSERKLNSKGDTSLVTGVQLDPFGSLTCSDDLGKVSSDQVVVWVDPLDGTSEYTEGLLEHVTVLIGVAVDGKPFGGVVHQPFWEEGGDGHGIGRSVWAVKGCGMGQEVGHETEAQLPLRLKGSLFRPSPPPKDKNIVVTSRSRRSPLIEAAVQALQPDEVIYAGGCGNKVLMLLEGRANFYVYGSTGTKKWDTCAPEAILVQAGGVLTDVFGTTLEYGECVDVVNRKGVLASLCPEKHGLAVDAMPQKLRDHLSS